jgi:hypothetical protein
MTRRDRTAEQQRLEQSRAREVHWKRWGPYLSERAWGTVREDYSPGGTAWDDFPHDHARSRAYRWNEDGLAGISDRRQRLCFALALWNGRDPILKERLFGLTGGEGNHGEDVKEYYYYLDSTPTHSYMRYLYKYPQAAYPYTQLLEENRKRGRGAPEFELVDTGVFDSGRYFDVFVEYAKADPEDLLIRIRAVNRGPEPAPLHLLPTAWFRNTWSWGRDDLPRPRLARVKKGVPGTTTVRLDHRESGTRWLVAEGECSAYFTENETNMVRLFGIGNQTAYVKDGINDYIVGGRAGAINPQQVGTKVALHRSELVAPGGTMEFRLRLSAGEPTDGWFDDHDEIFAAREREADAFYETVIPADLSLDGKRVMRQALGGMLWSKQFYHYVVKDWLEGDPAQPPPPEARKTARNSGWSHLYNADVLSMPDKWEYPWYAAWDLAFHCIALAIVDPDFAKEQLLLLLREWYMHPSGQLPAYEWAFGDVNPPVHAWAVWRVYKMDKKRHGQADTAFLERAFPKMLLNFSWWVNRKDAEGNNLFQGGFLGLDNIGVFDRSAPLPTGGHLEQSDGTSWMAMYTLNLLSIALELSCVNPSYEDIASKLWEHFLHISRAMNNLGGEGVEMWNESDGFYYDVLHIEGEQPTPMRIRSMVGLIPLFAVEALDPEVVKHLPEFKKRRDWFVAHHPEMVRGLAVMGKVGEGERRLLSIVNPERLRRVLTFILDEREFLSEYGIRALSRYHHEHPYLLKIDGFTHRVDYEPAESSNGLFGGNSNWRGPIWFPVNYLLIESLQKFHHFLGDEFKVECPTGSGRWMHLGEVATELSRRLTSIFLRGSDGRRPVYGNRNLFQNDPHFRDLVLFHEYFEGDNGIGLGASHQTGWTGIVAKLLQREAAALSADEEES